MRAKILLSLLACVSAAPSIVPPYPYALPTGPWGYAPVLVAPTIPSGDIQAAVIDAQVKIADKARFIKDQAIDLAEQLVETQNQGVINANDLAKEKSGEAFWAAEERKWQALNAAQIAEARLAGSVASEAVSTEDKAEIKSADAEVKTEEIKNEAMEMKSDEKLAVKTIDAEKSTEVEMPIETKKEETADAKSLAPEITKPEDHLEALKSAIASINMANKDALEALKTSLRVPFALAPGFNLQQYISPLSYQAYNPYQHIPTLPYQPTLALKNVW